MRSQSTGWLLAVSDAWREVGAWLALRSAAKVRCLFRPATRRFRSNCWHVRLYTTVLLCVSIVLPFVSGRSAQAVMLLAPEQHASRADKGGRDSDGVALPAPGQSVERELAGGQKHSYQITLAEGQYLSVVVEQRGINVAVQVVGTQGETITEWDRELTLQGQENAELVADTAGSYRVTVEARPKMAAPATMEFASQNCVLPLIEIGPYMKRARSFGRVAGFGSAGSTTRPASLERALEIRRKCLARIILK